MITGNAGDQRVVSERIARSAEWTPRLGDDVMFSVVLPSFAPDGVRAELDLIDIGDDSGFLLHPLQVRWLEIGGPDGAQSALIQDRLEALQRADVAILVRVRPVHQHQV